MKNQLALFIFFLCSTSFTIAQSGYLDAGFGDNGTVVRDIGNSNEYARDAALQQDGKLVIVGARGIIDYDFAILRYLENGMPDPHFGVDGYVALDFDGLDDYANAVAVQKDGKIVIAGETEVNDSLDFGIARILPDGSEDFSFGEGGTVRIDLGRGFEYANAVTVQEDGKIIVVGRTASKTFTDFAMVRLLTDGTLDKTFGDEGIVITSFRDEDEATEVAVQPDGKIIVSGYSSVLAQGDFAMARYNEDGTLDKAFGVGGKVLTDAAGGSDVANGMALLPDGSILLAGIVNYFNLAQTADIGMIKYLNDGSVDLVFGNGGRVILEEGEVNDVKSIAMQRDGKILLAGRTDHPDGEGRWMLSRFLSNGTLDSIFGSNGFVTTAFPGNFEFATKVLVAKDTRITLAGASRPSSNFDFTVARYIAEFVIDVTTFGNTCFGMADGGLQVNASEGAAPYSYSLDGNTYQAGNLFDGLPPGSYDVYVRDASGTVAVYGPATISSAPLPPPITVTVDGNDISISVDGTSHEFLYSIDGSNFIFQPFFPDLPDGLYHIVVLDQNSCIIHSSEVLIDETNTFDVQQENLITIAPNPSVGQFAIHARDQIQEGIATVFDFRGIEVWEKNILSNDNQPIHINIGHLVPGIYQFVIRNSQKVSVHQLVLIK